MIYEYFITPDTKPLEFDFSFDYIWPYDPNWKPGMRGQKRAKTLSPIAEPYRRARKNKRRTANASRRKNRG